MDDRMTISEAIDALIGYVTRRMDRGFGSHSDIYH